MVDEKPAYTVDEVAELLSMNPQTIRKWIREGDLDAAKLGRGYRIDRPALERFWKARGGTALFLGDDTDRLDELERENAKLRAKIEESGR